MKFPTESPFYPIVSENIVAETDRCVAFYDRYPLSRGHTLVVPKILVASLYELGESVQAEMWDLVRRARALLLDRFRPDGFNIGVNDGVAAGQTVLHAHIHLIPRYSGDCNDPRGGIRWIIPDRARYW